MATHKPFRELLKPGTNFEFIGKQRLWITISILLSLASAGMLFVNRSVRGSYMNWSTDFKGGTEIIFGFHKAGTKDPIEVDSAKIRKGLADAGHDNFEVSDFSWEEEATDGSTHKATGMLVRTSDYGAVPAAQQRELQAQLLEQFKGSNVLKATWSGDRMFVRSTKPIDWKAASEFFAKAGYILKPWEEQTERFTTPDEGTGEYNAQLSLRGIDAQYQKVLEESLGKDVDVSVINVYGVGAKAGEKLRNDGIASLFYAMALIMLYLVVRFDIRYAPGAVVAMIHDAILVIGVFALIWEEVSLTTVAAILTVVGYSVNDTVIIFDRIRENTHKLKDKKFARIINISINETLSRSLLTSLTVFVTTLMMNLFGTGLVRNFAFAMNIGVIVGTYSSVFIASPVALFIHNRYYAAESGAPVRGRKPVPGEEPIEEAEEGV